MTNHRRHSLLPDSIGAVAMMVLCALVASIAAPAAAFSSSSTRRMSALAFRSSSSAVTFATIRRGATARVLSSPRSLATFPTAHYASKRPLPVPAFFTTIDCRSGRPTNLRRSFTGLTTHYATSSSASKGQAKKTRRGNNKNQPPSSSPVPVTLLSGFLGSGKTSALKHLLENREGIRVGVIVNDVASVNIDARLITNIDGSGGGMAAPDDSVMAGLTSGMTVELQNGCACCSLADELLTSIQTLMSGRDFDAVVVELSGVADPTSVKMNWEQAKLMQHPATRLANVNRVVTVVDACTFGTDYMTWDKAGERDRWVEPGDECSAQRNVPEVLAEQVEAADLLLINKIDLAGSEQVTVATNVARALNDKANVFEVEFGRISPKDILGDDIDMEQEQEEEENETTTIKGEGGRHSHDHEHHHHGHGREEDGNSSSASTCTDPKCTDPTHDHSHSHNHHDEDCTDPNCTDPSHSHSHDHQSSSATSTDRLGISSFVYRASVPFSTIRLLNLLNRWPVPIKEELDIGQLQKAQAEGYRTEDGLDSGSPFLGVLRSKGFCWLAPTRWSGGNDDVWRHDTAMYWSHAGKHFGITSAGKWWGTIGKDKMKQYFTANMDEYERILREDWASEEFGDRRQELVFIGTNLDEKAITEALNDCLLSDKEMAVYRQQLRHFIDTMFTTEVNSGPSLFDMDGIDHMDVK